MSGVGRAPSQPREQEEKRPSLLTRGTVSKGRPQDVTRPLIKPVLILGPGLKPSEDRHTLPSQEGFFHFSLWRLQAEEGTGISSAT